MEIDDYGGDVGGISYSSSNSSLDKYQNGNIGGFIGNSNVIRSKSCANVKMNLRQVNRTERLSTFGSPQKHEAKSLLTVGGLTYGSASDELNNPYDVLITQQAVQLQNPFSGIKSKSINQLLIGGGNTIINESVKDEKSSQRSSTGTNFYHELDTLEVTVTSDYQSDEEQQSMNSTIKKAENVDYDLPDYPENFSYEDLPSPVSLPLPPSMPSSDLSDDYQTSLSITNSSSSGGTNDDISSLLNQQNISSSISSTPPIELDDAERKRISCSYSGQSTSHIYVSSSYANLYFLQKNKQDGGSVISPVNPNTEDHGGEWILKHCGIPVILLEKINVNNGKSISTQKRIEIILAEPTSGLSLWRDTINHLSNYKIMDNEKCENSIGKAIFQTMHLSTNHSQIIGLSFDIQKSAFEFWKEIEKLTSDFENIQLSGKKIDKTKLPKSNPKKKWIRPNKKDISQPCAFQHVSTLNPKDKRLLNTFQNFIGKHKNPGNMETSDPSKASINQSKD